MNFTGIIIGLLMVSVGVFGGTVSSYNNLTFDNVRKASRITMWNSGLLSVVLCAILLVLII